MFFGVFCFRGVGCFFWGVGVFLYRFYFSWSFFSMSVNSFLLIFHKNNLI